MELARGGHGKPAWSRCSGSTGRCHGPQRWPRLQVWASPFSHAGTIPNALTPAERSIDLVNERCASPKRSRWLKNGRKGCRKASDKVAPPSHPRCMTEKASLTKCFLFWLTPLYVSRFFACDGVPALSRSSGSIGRPSPTDSCPVESVGGAMISISKEHAPTTLTTSRT